MVFGSTSKLRIEGVAVAGENLFSMRNSMTVSSSECVYLQGLLHELKTFTVNVRMYFSAIKCSALLLTPNFLDVSVSKCPTSLALSSMLKRGIFK